MREKLIAWLKENKMKRSVFSRLSGVKYQTLTDVIIGRTSEDTISITNALKIAKAMGTTVEELYDRPPPERHEIKKDIEDFQTIVDLAGSGWGKNMFMEKYHSSVQEILRIDDNDLKNRLAALIILSQLEEKKKQIKED